MTVANDSAIRRALEAAGVMFIDENGVAGLGVRLRSARHLWLTRDGRALNQNRSSPGSAGEAAKV